MDGKARKARQARGKTVTAAVAANPIFEGYWLQLRAAPLAAQREAVLQLAGALRGRKPRVELMAAHGRNDSVAREFVISGQGARTAAIDNAQAWDGARWFLRSPWVVAAEPLFATPGLEPDARHAGALLAPFERKSPQAKSAGSAKPLPCASQNPIWHLEMIKAPEAWLLPPPAGGRRFGAGVVIGHPDTGYTPHPEIWDPSPPARRLDPGLGYNFEENKASPLDPMGGSHPGHGTATASVIMSAAGGPQTPFVTGSAPECRLVPLRVSDSVIHFSFKNATRAIYHAVDRAGAQVISMSLGGPLHSAALKNAIDYAVGKGVVVMAAAGNVWPWVVYPARFDSVIAVAACNCEKKPWKDSASGEDVDVTAPGESVWRAQARQDGAKLDFSVAPSSGTSYAVATLAGACATWLAFHGRDQLIARYGAARIAQTFRQALVGGGVSRPAGWDTGNYGAGILDVRALLSAALPPVSKSARARKSASAGPPAPGAAIAVYFPASERAGIAAAVRKALAPAAGPARKSVASERLLEAELAFHVATNAAVRAALRQQARRPAAKSRAAAASSKTLLAAMDAPSSALSSRLNLGRSRP